MAIKSHISILTLTINVLNCTMKKQKIAIRFKKKNQEPPLFYLEEKHLIFKDKDYLRMKRWKV